MLVHIDDSGRAVKLSGNKRHPITQGFLCAKVTKYLDREYHPDRLKYPLRRTGAKGEGRFERISWDEALRAIAEQLKTISDGDGPEAILPYSYAGTMGFLNGAGMDRRFFHRLGACRLDRTICATAGGTALVASQGIKLGTEPEQFAQAKLIIAWGANILGTNVHLWPWIVEARRRGAKFYVIDPVKNRTGKLADRHYAVNPGSDLALALGLMHVIFRESLEDREYVTSYAKGLEELQALAAEYPPCRVSNLTGIAAEEIEQLAREYATANPAAIRLNYGVQRSDRGASAVRAIAALPVLTGSWRSVGGGIQLSTSGAFQLNYPALERADLQLASPLGREARLVNMSELGTALNRLENPRIQALIVYNSNPAAVAPNQSSVLAGLRREDLFTVVLEHFETDTADFADIVLPATTFLEHTDLYMGYGHYYLQLARPVLPAPGEAKSNVEIFRLLAQRMGFGDACFNDTEDDMLRDLLNSKSRYLEGITLEHLEKEGFARLNVAPDGEPFLPFRNGDFATTDGRFDFGAETLRYTAPRESRLGDETLARLYPIELISAKNDDSLNSTFGYRKEVDNQTSMAWINPADAEARGIQEGAKVKLFNDRGACFFHAHISSDIRKGVVRTPSTRWNKFAPAGRGVNTLTSDRLTDFGGGPTFYSCLVEIAAEE